MSAKSVFGSASARAPQYRTGGCATPESRAQPIYG
jgi:hypothetical protein